MIQQWIKDISPSAAKIIDHFQDVKYYGKSNPYIVNIENKAFSSRTVILFGANLKRFQIAKFPAGITVTYGYNTYTYNEFLANTMNSPFEIGIIRIETNNPNGFVAQNFNLGVRTNEPTGEQTTTNFPVFRRLNQFQQDAVEFNLNSYNFFIDGDVEFIVSVRPLSNTKIYFYPSSRASFKMLMNEGYFAKKNTLPAIPLTPNREIYYEPIEVKMKDSSPKIIV